MINAVTKDRILDYLLNVGKSRFTMTIEQSDVELFQATEDEIRLIMDQFEERGLIEMKKFSGGMVVWIRANAYDFKNHGGFVGQEELLQWNLEKLLLEIESLKPSMPDKVDRITTIAANISTALGLFTSAFIKGS